MPDKSLPPRFAETIPLGVVSLILGVSSVSVSSRIPAMALLFSATGALFGFLTLNKSSTDKLDKSSAVIGFLTSFGNLVFILVTMVNK